MAIEVKPPGNVFMYGTQKSLFTTEKFPVCDLPPPGGALQLRVSLYDIRLTLGEKWKYVVQPILRPSQSYMLSWLGPDGKMHWLCPIFQTTVDDPTVPWEPPDPPEPVEEEEQPVGLEEIEEGPLEGEYEKPEGIPEYED